MKCQYPNCMSQAWYIPVIVVPTLRTSSTSDEFVETADPTIITAPEVCQRHKETYDLTYWLKPQDWAKMNDVARSQGRKLEDQKLIQIRWRPVGWTPQAKWMELER